MSQVRSITSKPSFSEIEDAFSRAYELARARRPSRVSEDSLNDGAAKWWRRINRSSFPVYLLGADGISVDYLAGWIITSAIEAQVEIEQKTRRHREHGFELVPDTTAEGETWQIPDRDTRPVDDLVLGKVDARTKVAGLGGVAEIDEVVRYRALDFSYEEIGEIVGIKAGAARVRAHRASERLASRLGEAA